MCRITKWNPFVSVLMTVFLSFLGTLPIIMMIMGKF